uniref:Uncharacterized protein n=1 Tax=Amphimedon queenslandica TaxID=400682 RepID=A0A1X7T8H9_AMPQE
MRSFFLNCNEFVLDFVRFVHVAQGPVTSCLMRLEGIMIEIKSILLPMLLQLLIRSLMNAVHCILLLLVIHD